MFTPCRVSRSQTLGNFRNEIYSTASQYAISNLCLNLTFSSSDKLVKATTMGALEVELCLVAAAASLCNRAIAWLCYSLLAWSRILLVRTESAPDIHRSLKFCLHKICDRNLAQTLHFSFFTTLVPPSTTVSQSNQVMVLHSRSNSRCHF